MNSQKRCGLLKPSKNKSSKLAQSSVEISVIMGISLIVLGVLIYVNLDISSSYSAKYSKDQIYLALDDVVSTMDLIYIQGSSAKSTVYVTLPEGIKNSSISDGTLLFNLYTSGEDYDQVYRIVDYNVTGNLPNSSGSYQVSIESFGGYLNVSYS